MKEHTIKMCTVGLPLLADWRLLLVDLARLVGILMMSI